MIKDIINQEIIQYCIQCDKLYDCDNNYSEETLLKCPRLKKIRGD